MCDDLRKRKGALIFGHASVTFRCQRFSASARGVGERPALHSGGGRHRSCVVHLLRHSHHRVGTGWDQRRVEEPASLHGDLDVTRVPAILHQQEEQAQQAKPDEDEASLWRTPRSGWCSTGPSRYATRRSYKAVYRPAVLRANRLTPDREAVPAAVVPVSALHVRELVPRCAHPAYRHRGAYGAPGRQDDADCLRAPDQHYDHTGNMAALGSLAAPLQKPNYGNVIPLHG